MKIPTLLIALLVGSALQAQDVVLKHKNYTTTFSKSLRYPTKVEWWVTKANLECKNPASRTDKFIPDPLLPSETNLDEDYKGSGFDRGHLSPAADNRCVVGAMNESFYFSNMAPQYPGLNRGQWKMLEEWTRDMAKQHDSVHVEAGCGGSAKKVKQLTIPTYCYKIVEIVRLKQIKYYVFPNKAERTTSLEQHEVKPDSIKKLRR